MARLRRNAKARVIRNEKDSLKVILLPLNMKRITLKKCDLDLNAVSRIKGFNDFEIGDTIESFIIEEVER